MKLSVYNAAGKVVDEVEIADSVFGVAANVPLMHQAVVQQEANKRVGTSSTKTRSEVRGTTKKMYKQKGTGRARHGSRKVPSWTGGGVAHGPHPRSYEQHMPKKMRRQAIRSALSVKARDGQIVLLQELTFDAPRTKDMLALLAALPVDGKVLVTLDAANQNVQLAARNLQRVSTLPALGLSTREVLRHDFLLATVPAIREVEAWLAPENGDGAETAPAAAPRARRSSARAAAPAADKVEADANPATARASSAAEAAAEETPTPKRPSRARAAAAAPVEVTEPTGSAEESEEKPAPRRRTRKPEASE